LGVATNVDVNVHAVSQVIAPLQFETLRDVNSDARRWPIELKLPSDDTGLYRLPEADLVREEVAHHRILQHASDDLSLVRQQFDPSRKETCQPTATAIRSDVCGDPSRSNLEEKRTFLRQCREYPERISITDIGANVKHSFAQRLKDLVRKLDQIRPRASRPTVLLSNQSSAG